MRNTIIAPEQHYHIYNRGNNKQHIFIQQRDYIRFLFYILYYQSPEILHNISDKIKHFEKHDTFNISDPKIDDILKNRTVELVAFSLMPNHFHLLVKELEKGGISKYLLRIQDAYTKYIHAKYDRSGHLLQGPYGAVGIETNDQLLYLSTYIHKQCAELKNWREKEDTYPWSSYQDFVHTNRWDELLVPHIILGQFTSPEEYQRFVTESVAKDLKEKFDDQLLRPTSH